MGGKDRLADASDDARRSRALVARARAAQAASTAGRRTVDEVVAAGRLGDHGAGAQPRARRDSRCATRAWATSPTRSPRTTARRWACCATSQGAKSVGVIAEHPAAGIIEIARPVGVVAAITPSTNPGATPANNIINALKCRNAIILAPSPKGHRTLALLLEFVHAELERSRRAARPGAACCPRR